ncbi:hypothetical protein M2105_004293 [Paenibacillus sp. PastF-1]|nr:hypothetical protein [Paenibacillus sp. PastF-2]MDF9849662.1 hypothetical protein [Paenibacillus sp. PastM-2]MDF9856420.1 hypothetical protein [Paenibacillus sp. PastF-1]MDH6481692.1 hypothetical protein [Paenibacillus sp. PastH-2]MDH6508973.1 hypothetical protein [Paenibacillus sp. PastM-3]
MAGDGEAPGSRFFLHIGSLPTIYDKRAAADCRPPIRVKCIYVCNRKVNQENYIYFFHYEAYNNCKVKVALGKLKCVKTKLRCEDNFLFL